MSLSHRESQRERRQEYLQSKREQVVKNKNQLPKKLFRAVNICLCQIYSCS